MLSNTIEIPVNHDNDDGTTPTVDHQYDRWEETLNRSTYVHTNHTLGAKDQLSFYRTLPKQSGTFRGMAKTAFKFSRDVTVEDSAGGTIIVPQIVHVTFSNPVGVSAADKLLARQRVAALLGLDAIMDPLQNQLMV